MFALKQSVVPIIEPLERRQLLCGHALNMGHGSSHGGDSVPRNGIVAFTGGKGIDWMFVYGDASTVTVQVNGVDHTYARSKVKGIKLDGGAGDDTLQVFDLDGTFNIPVTMMGGKGKDDLEGGGEKDYMNGGADDDFMFGNGGNDVMLGGDGNDIMNAGSGNDVLLGGNGDDQMAGGEGDDYLYGNRGNDMLFGYEGNDHLNGGQGTDFVEGDDGTDVYSSKADADVERMMDDLDTVVARFARPVL